MSPGFLLLWRLCRSCIVACSIASLFFLLDSPAARGQEEYSRWEVGGEYAAFRGVSDARSDVSFYAGLGGRIAWNLNRRLAFEAEVDATPGSLFTNFKLQGGNALSAVFGARAKVVQSRHWAVFGLLRPGVLHFTAVGHGDPPFADRRSESFFALNLGGGVEYYPSPRWIVRFDITGNPYRVPNSIEKVTPFLGAAGPTPTPILGEINDQFRLTFGVGYRLGKLHESEWEDGVTGKLELGPQFTLTQMQRRFSATGVESEPGAGGFASYPVPLLRFLYADGSLIYYPRGASPGFQDGGTLLEGLFGIKGGVRRNRLGLFGKVRPGFVRSTEAVSGFEVVGSGPTVRETITSYGTFAMDLGGVIEVYASKRQLLRFDIGDTHLYYHTTFIRNPDGSVTTLPGGIRQHSIQTSVAYGWRF